MTHDSTFRTTARLRRPLAVLSAAVVAGGMAAALPAHADATSDIIGPDDPREGWQLVAQEDFSEPLSTDGAPWAVDPHGDDSPWHVDTFDDDGQYFVNQGGEEFLAQLDSFDLLRKSVSFGEGGWLTAEYAARDYDRDGVPDAPPSLTSTTLADGTPAAFLDEPSHDTGLIIRSTRALPSQYRVEYRLKGLNFGGQRDGEWNYDGLVNGYSTDGCKTNFPWKRRGDFSGEPGPCNPNFNQVRSANGYYFLSIMDYPNPAPRNNVFIHTHRKVGMDLYTVSGSEGRNYSVCNPATGNLYRQDSAEATGNGINAIFFRGDEFRDPSIAYNEFRMETECGSFDGSGAGTSIVSTAEIRPELMPEEDYLFAIERHATGYTMEMSGNFLHVGEATLRYTRDFVQDGEPIWHYNNTAEEYDGSFDQSLEFTGPHGEYTIEHTWPAGSAYPDFFILGDPHTNYYEGNATIADIRLYVPETESVDALVAGLSATLDGYVQSGDVAGPLAHQLTNAVMQAQRHLEQDRTAQAQGAINRFLRHLEEPKPADTLTDAARDDLTRQAWLIRQLTG